MLLKKMGIALSFVFSFASFAQALDMQALYASIERSVNQAAAQEKIPTKFADAEKQRQFNENLAKGLEILCRSGVCAPAEEAVIEEDFFECSRECIISEEEKPQFLMQVLINALETTFSEVDDLTNDEKRAVRYALYVLMVNGDEKEKYAAYREHLNYTPQWQKENPVEDWATYKNNCQQAMDNFYTIMANLVEAEADGTLNELLCNSTWMMMTH